MRKSILSVGLALTLLASNGCSLGSTGKRSGATAASDSREIAVLKAQIVELQRRAVVADVEIGRLLRRLADLESGARKRPADDGTQAKSLAPPREVRPRLESADSPVSGSSGRASLEGSDLPVVSATATGAGIGSGAGGDSDGVAGADAALTASAQELYDRGYTLFHQGHYVDSETAFQQFLLGYSATVLGDNAQFWIAEARYARGDVNGALAAYRETAARFPAGNKVPDAKLKIGDCLRELGETEAARQSYRSVIREFPSSAAATAARERLTQSP